MSQDEGKARSQADEELEREIRKGRKYSLDEAIGRLVEPGAMKGATPITCTRKAEAVIEESLRMNLGGGTECLQAVLLRQVMGSERLLNNPEPPEAALADYLRQLMASEELLRDLVRETDAEWGRTYEERPHFDMEGSPPDPGDPYTRDSVFRTLSELLERLGNP